jgi:hypothetical protein
MFGDVPMGENAILRADGMTIARRELSTLNVKISAIEIRGKMADRSPRL